MRITLQPDMNLGTEGESVTKRLAFPSEGWVVPVQPGTLRPVRLHCNSRLQGHFVLSMTGTQEVVRLWHVPSTNGTPLLAAGQTITNGMPVTFATPGGVTEVWLEALAPGTASVTFSFIGTGNAEGLNHSDTLNITVQSPMLGYRIASDYSVTNLLNSTFSGAFQPNGQLVQPDFINAVSDRFQLWVEDPRRTNATITANLHYGTGLLDSFEATLYRQPDGRYLSTNMLVVADFEDRSAIAGLFETSPSQPRRAIRNALGDEVWLTYKQHDGITITNTATIGKDIKTLTVDIAVMTANGVAVVSNNIVERDTRVIQERFAQTNVKVTVNRLPDFPAPQIVATNLSNWYVNGQYAYKTLTQMSKDIIDAANPAPRQNPCLIYVPSLRFWLNEATPAIPGGAAVTKYYFGTGNDTNYTGNAFIAAGAPQITPPHELIHLLEVEDHEMQATWNLMYHTDSGDTSILGMKRLTQPQIDLIRTNGNLYVK